jgi:hypothetical protein
VFRWNRDPSLTLGISEKDPKDLKTSREADHAPSGAVESADGAKSKNNCAAVWSAATEILVEAVGVEPTSENVTGQEPTYLVSVHATGITPPHSPLALRTDKKRKRLARGSRSGALA